MAQHLEVGADVDSSLAGPTELREAMDAFSADAKLQQQLAAAKQKKGPP